ncbi:MAG: metallophosphoesterase [Paludibacter sp.]|nr:metallophosphoesterase [Paludibacter sp.]
MKRCILTCLLITLIISVFSQNEFRFALITDTHISIKDSSSLVDLDNAITEINSQENIEFILVSGDVSHLADVPSLIKAKQILDKSRKPYHVVPGNHDVNWKEGELANFLKVFGDDKFIFETHGFMFAGFATRPDSVGAKAYIFPNDISWIKLQVDKYSDKPFVIVTHYPLLTGDVKNWKDLTELLQKYDVRFVINGHYHRNSVFNYAGIPGIVCRSTLRAGKTAGGYTIFELSDNRVTVYEKVIGKPEIDWLSFPFENK